jgi:PAS domain S-box-containing protein
LIINNLETGIVVEANLEACLMHGYTRQEFVGRQLTGFIHPGSQHAFIEHIRSFQSDSELDSRILHVCKDGSTFYAEWRGTAFMYQGRSCLLSVVRDVNKRIQAEQLLYQHAETRTLEQETLLAITFAICGFHFRQVTELHVG